MCRCEQLWEVFFRGKCPPSVSAFLFCVLFGLHIIFAENVHVHLSPVLCLVLEANNFFSCHLCQVRPRKESHYHVCLIIRVIMPFMIRILNSDQRRMRFEGVSGTRLHAYHHTSVGFWITFTVCLCMCVRHNLCMEGSCTSRTFCYCCRKVPHTIRSRDQINGLGRCPTQSSARIFPYSLFRLLCTMPGVFAASASVEVRVMVALVNMVIPVCWGGQAFPCDLINGVIRSRQLHCPCSLSHLEKWGSKMSSLSREHSIYRIHLYSVSQN